MAAWFGKVHRYTPAWGALLFAVLLLFSRVPWCRPVGYWLALGGAGILSVLVSAWLIQRHDDGAAVVDEALFDPYQPLRGGWGALILGGTVTVSTLIAALVTGQVTTLLVLTSSLGLIFGLLAWSVSMTQGDAARIRKAATDCETIASEIAKSPAVPSDVRTAIERAAKDINAPTWTSRYLSIGAVTAVAGSLFAIYKLLGGSFMAGGTLDVTAVPIRSLPADTTGEDYYAVTFNLKRNEQWAIRLIGAQIRLTSCRGENDPGPQNVPESKSNAQTLSFVPNDNVLLRGDDPQASLQSGNFASSHWQPREPVNTTIGSAYADSRFALGPNEGSSFSVIMHAPKNSFCVVEAAILFRQFFFIETNSVMLGSTVLAPVSGKTDS